MQIAIRNICENAIKHGQREHLHIIITAKSGADNVLKVNISDNGVGFAKPALAFLNGGSFRVDSGYGLFGVRRMINARGGYIKANNRVGGGSVICFSLPGKCLQNIADVEYATI